MSAKMTTEEGKEVTVYVVAGKIRKEMRLPNSRLKYNGRYSAFAALMEEAKKVGGLLPCRGFWVDGGRYFRFTKPIVPELPQISTDFIQFS